MKLWIYENHISELWKKKKEYWRKMKLLYTRGESSPEPQCCTLLSPPYPCKNIYREGRENLYSSTLALWNDVRNAESQPGPQGIPSHFQRKKPWGRGWWKPLITFILTRKTRLANTYQLFLYRPLYYGRLLGRWLFATQLHEKLRKIN